MAKYLIAKEGLLKDLFFVIEDEEEYRIGRDPDLSDFVLNDPSVSRKHALISKTDDGFSITDLSHTNPTLVNGEIALDNHLLKEGDALQIGKTEFTYTSKRPQDETLEKLPDEDREKKESPFAEPGEDYETIFEEEKEIIPSPEKEQIPLLENKEEPLPSIEDKEEPIPSLEEKLLTPKENEEPEAEEKLGEETEEEESPEEKNIEIISEPHESKEQTPYDTIFEEETEEELPFNLISDSSLILKVISGSNAGAEFGMDKGKSYIIGKDSTTCNIVFNDLSVSKEHAKLTIEPDGSIYIEDLGSRNGIIVNSKKIDQKKLISSKDIIVLGSTVFVVIDPQEAQETIYAPLPSVFEEAQVEKPLEEMVEKEKPPKGPGEWRQLIIPKNHLIVGVSIVLILFVIFLTFFSLFKSNKVEMAIKEPKEEIKKAFEKFPGVQFSFNPTGGKLFLVGHILTAIEQQELIYNIDNLPFVDDVENNVIIDEYVWKNTNDLLNNNTSWRSVSIHSSTPGVFIASGYVQSPQELETLTNYLKANFPYVDKLQNRVVIEDVLKTEIEGLILSKGLSAISYQIASGEVILAGRYGMDDEKSYNKLLDEIKKLEGVRSIKNAAIKTNPDMARIDLTQKYNITGVITSDNKNIVSVIANNKLINIEGFLDGMKVTEIKLNTIYLEKDGLKYKINYIR